MKKIPSLIIILCLFFASCKKYLDEKPNVKLTVPTSLADFQALLDDNLLVDNVTPGVADLGTDDYYLSLMPYQALAAIPSNCYTWQPLIFNTPSSFDWQGAYRNIYIANVVLDGLNDYHPGSIAEQTQWNTIYGHALFLRGLLHYHLEEIFGQPYRPSTADADLGVPLKLTSNLADKATRPSVKKAIDQIIADLRLAAALLPSSTLTKNRPNKAAAYAMLSRTYLTAQNYSKAKEFADSSLKNYSYLFDYNTVTSATNPFTTFAPPKEKDFPSETTFFITQQSYGVIRLTTTSIDSNLYNSYDNNDCRKTVFFSKNTATNTYYFKGNYSGSSATQFTGPAVDEMYLTRAECYAREGNKDQALVDLNTLMIKRWKNTVPYPQITAVDAEDALRKVLVERRKELIFRGIRWEDLRRLNQDPRFAITLKRDVVGQIYTLLPNDKKYTYPIPDDEILLSGIQQNIR